VESHDLQLCYTVGLVLAGDILAMPVVAVALVSVGGADALVLVDIAPIAQTWGERIVDKIEVEVGIVGKLLAGIEGASAKFEVLAR
jgi:hypothetical protein